MPWYRRRHWQIVAGMILGLVFGIASLLLGWGDFVSAWVAPLGRIFISLLKLIAVPLVLVSLIAGVASLSDLRSLSRIGGKTIAIYLGTTTVAVCIGLVLVNIFAPGNQVPPEMRDRLQTLYQADASSRTSEAREARQRNPIEQIADIVPENFFASASDNRNMLQVVFVALLLGVGIIQVPTRKVAPLVDAIEGLNLVIIRLVDIIMLLAPLGVFALISGTITSVASQGPAQALELLQALGFYCLLVVAGLAVHTLIVYTVLLRLFTPMPLRTFFRGIAPAQLVAFSTSSSGATLPVTMERCREKLGVSEEVSSFVLPVGATINMDGTALYQAIAAVFIAQVVGMELSLSAQATIVMTAVLASIGTAAIPSAGIIMLVIILEAVGAPSAGIALILGVDRILDMLRTVTNVTGDCTVAVLVSTSEGQLGEADLSEDADSIRVHRED